MKIKIPDTDLVLNVKKGNRKPIPPFVWLISMTSSEDCPARSWGMCEIGDDCYVLAYERNPFMRDQTLNARSNDEAAIDYLVANNMAGFLADQLIRRDRLSRSHKLKYLRWNESGDMKSLDHFLFVDEIADLLNEQHSTIQDLTEELGKMEKEIKQS